MKGIYLVEPDGQWIAEGKKTAIVKKKPYSENYVEEDVYLCSDEFVYGIINMDKPKKINLEEFKDLEDRHQISEERRIKWWGEDTKEFFYYTFKKIEIFEEPKEYEYEPGVQREIKDVKFKKDISTGITTTGDIDIMEILYAPLRPEEKRKLQLETFRAEGIDADLKEPQKRYKQIIADARYLANSAFANFGKEGAWKDWTKEDILKYFAACIDALRSIHIALVPPTNKELYEKEHPNKDPEEAKETSYWKCYTESKKHMKSEPPKDEKELGEWKEKRKKLLEKSKAEEELEEKAKKEEKLDEKEKMDFLNIRADILEDLKDKEVKDLHQEGHYYWQLYEKGELKDIELLINNHVLLVQEMVRRDLKHFPVNGLDFTSQRFFPGYDKKGSILLFEHEQIHRDYEEEPCELLFLQHLESEAQLMKSGYKHVDHGDELDKYYVWHNEHELALVNPSGEFKGREIKLDEILQYLKHGFRLRSPYVYLSGGLVHRGTTVNDIEIVVQCTQSELDSRQGHLLKWRIMRMFPPELAKRLHFLASAHIGPITDNIPLYALSCERINENNDIFEMSIDEGSFDMRKALIRTKAPLAEKQAQKAKRTDKITLGEFFLPMKPTRSYFPETRSTIDSFVKFFKDEDFPIYSSRKLDGARHIIHKMDSQIHIWSEDGERNEKSLVKIAGAVKKLNAKNCILDTEIESYEDRIHRPREFAAGLIHSKTLRDESLIATAFDILYYNDKDLHKVPFEERLKILEKLNFPQSTEKVPDVEKRLNLIPHHLNKNRAELRGETERLRKLPASEGNVAKIHDFIFNLKGLRSGEIKFHNNALINVIVIKKIPTKVSGVSNYQYGILVGDEKVPDEKIADIAGKKYYSVGKTFSTAKAMKPGDRFHLEFETLNATRSQATDEIRISCWVPRFIETTDETVDTIDSAMRKAKRERVLQLKEITEEGKTIYKMLDETEILSKALTYEDVPDEDQVSRFVMQNHYRGKSVSDLTPIMTRRGNILRVRPIMDLWAQEVKPEFQGFQHPLDGIEIWTENGWEKAKWILRHGADEKLIRVNAYGGAIDITGDHSLFGENGNLILGRDLQVGSKIKFIESYPKISERFQVPRDFAWMLGFFIAEGSFKFGRNTAKFTQKDGMYFELIESFAHSRGLGFSKWKEQRGNNNWACELTGLNIFRHTYSKTFLHTASLRMSYFKIIPDFVFEWNNEAKVSFIKGFIDGDGDGQPFAFSNSSQAVLQGILLLMENIYNRQPSIYLQRNLFRVRAIETDKNEQRFERERNRIRDVRLSTFKDNRGRKNPRFKDGRYDATKFKGDILKWFYNKNRYVYDIETSSHSFSAGVGKILAHNSSHIDFRAEAKGKKYLCGFTIDDLIKGAIKEPVRTMAQAKVMLGRKDISKIDWHKGKFKMRRTASGAVVPTQLRAQEKKLEPQEWVSVEGVTPKGSVGATKTFPGVFIIRDKGIAEFLAVKPYFKEFWLDGQHLKGRLVFRQLTAWTTKELDEDDLEKVLPPSKGEEVERTGIWWSVIQPLDQLPYVLSDRAVEKAWIPPPSFSALPRHLRTQVPAEFQYWEKPSEKERIKIRDAYVAWLKENKKYDELKKSLDLAELKTEPKGFCHWVVSEFLECKIKDVFANSVFVPQPKIGNFLKALQETLKDFQTLDIRNFDDRGYESPPIYQVVKLNSKQEEDFLIEGMQFLENKLGQRYVIKTEPTFGGLDFTLISRSIFRQLNKDLLAKTFDWIKEHNFLKNEKFTLNGEFLKAPENLNWEDLKLEKSLKENMLRVNKLVTEEGKLYSRGLLMVGPPGVGKTMSCRLLMKDAKSTFIWVTAKEFSGSALSMAFSLARELAPTILCFEDIDTYIHGHAVDLFKTELDGLIANEGLCVILTTNHPEELPLSLLDRPGRFHDICNFQLPDQGIRAEMILHFAKEEVETETMKRLIEETEGFSGAHIRELVSFAKRIQAEQENSLEEAFLISLEKLKQQKDLVAEILANKEREPFRLSFLKAQEAEKISEKDARFVLQNHVFRGQKVIREGWSEGSHWDVRIDTGKPELIHFVLWKNPLEYQSISGILKPCKDKKSMTVEYLPPKKDAPYSEYKERSIPFKTELNPTISTPAFIWAEDRGSCVVLEDSDIFKKIEFKGKKLKGSWAFIREDPKGTMWRMEYSAVPEPKKELVEV